MKRIIRRLARALASPFSSIITKKLEPIQKDLAAIKRNQDILVRAAANPYLKDMRSFVAEKQLSFEETLRHVVDNKVSFTRFGDGEIRLMLRFEYKLRFQKNSLELRRALRETIEYARKHPKQLLLGFPHPYESPHWTAVWVDIWDEAKELFSGFRQLGNSHVSRPIFFMEHGQDGVEMWREVWNAKRVLVITGEGSRFELLPALFDNAAEIEFLHSLPANAFNDLDRVVEIATTKDAELVLISLGPAGTVIAAQLAARGKWAIDIGHISDSYQNVFEGAAWPESKPLRNGPSK